MLKRKISVCGLGYVGLTIANAFGQISEVIGFDVNEQRLKELSEGYDRNGEIAKEQLNTARIEYTKNPDRIKSADFHIIAVPTPLDDRNHPDLTILENATKTIGQQLKRGDCVVYESSVYPGVTEEIALPILEKVSGLTAGKDFMLGFSPERVNPGDRVHTLDNTVKIVSGINPEATELIASVYRQVIQAGVFKAVSIKVAEATKIIENTQRDLNISLMNEIAIILHQFGVNMTDVLEAAQTKWNFLSFKPGLVGGHCIGINAYYLAHKAEQVGYRPNFILEGQEVNDNMIRFIAEETIKNIHEAKGTIHHPKIGILGITYKENYPDFHDSKVVDLIRILQKSSANIMVHDPIINYEHAKKELELNFVQWDQLSELDAIVIAVAHEQYCQLTPDDFKKLMKPTGVLVDVKGILDSNEVKKSGLKFWQI